MQWLHNRELSKEEVALRQKKNRNLPSNLKSYYGEPSLYEVHHRQEENLLSKTAI